MNQAGNKNKREKTIEIWLFFIVLICYVYTFPRWADPNQNSRLDMIVAVVDDHSFEIDKYVINTVDYAMIDGHYYSDKAPGMAFLGIPVYSLLSRFFQLPIWTGIEETIGNNSSLMGTLREDGTGLSESKLKLAITQTILSFLLSAIPSAFLCILIYRMATLLGAGTFWSIILAVGYGLLTPAFAYANTIYGHQLSGGILFYVFYRNFRQRGKISKKELSSLGFLLGISFTIEYPVFLAVGILLIYVFLSLKMKRQVFWVITGALPVAIGWMLYNQNVFGSPLELGYSHSTLWTAQHQTGFMSLTRPSLEAAWGITFSMYRGLFALSPFLLLSIPGFFLWARSGEHKKEIWTTFYIVVLFYLFNSASIMWWGGYAIGPRYILPMLPFLVLPVVFTLRQWGSKYWLKTAYITSSIWSFIFVWGLSLAGQSFPSDTIRNPLVSYALPNWLDGNIARNLGMFIHLSGVYSLLPLLFLLLISMVLLWLWLDIKANNKFEISLAS